MRRAVWEVAGGFLTMFLQFLYHFLNSSLPFPYHFLIGGHMCKKWEQDVRGAVWEVAGGFLTMFLHFLTISKRMAKAW